MRILLKILPWKTGTKLHQHQVNSFANWTLDVPNNDKTNVEGFYWAGLTLSLMLTQLSFLEGDNEVLPGLV